jgi:hypothetical protein
METSEVSKLILKNCFRVVQVDELCLMGLQLNHMPDMTEPFLEVRYKSYSSRTSRLREFKHLEHPSRNVAQSFFCYKLQHSTVSHFRTVFQAKNKWIFILGA